MNIHQINKKRLWLLFTFISTAVLCIYYFPDISKQYQSSEGAWQYKRDQNRKLEYASCLKESNTSLSELYRTYSHECKIKDNNMYSGVKEQLDDICVRSKSKECSHILYAITADQLKKSSISKELETSWEKIMYFFKHNYSHSFKVFIFLLLAIPIFLAFIPKSITSLYRWLTSTHA